MIQEKITQAVNILKEKQIDAWLTFVRESHTMADPCLETILGTHCTWQSAFIITAQGETIAIVGSLDAANIKSTGLYAEVIGYQASIREPLVEAFQRINPNKIAINYSKNDYMSDGLTYGMYQLLLDYLGDTPYADRLVSSEAIISALRGRKSPTEIERIKAAVKLTEQIFDKVTHFLRPGLSEKEIAQFILEQTRQAGAGVAWDEAQCPSVFTGPESAGAHFGPTDRKTEPGHLMNIDFGVKLDGYCSDLQRTWYFLREEEPEAPAEVQRAFEAVRDAIELAARALKPGVVAWEIDNLARQHIISQGFEEYPHALGHQIGRRAHDGAGVLCPQWERYGQLPFEKVEANQVYTLEPRVTCKGYGVATIEEIVVVRETGAEFLSQPQRKLICIQ